jgi:hypothetical protein
VYVCDSMLCFLLVQGCLTACHTFRVGQTIYVHTVYDHVHSRYCQSVQSVCTVSLYSKSVQSVSTVSQIGSKYSQYVPYDRM